MFSYFLQKIDTRKVDQATQEEKSSESEEEVAIIRKEDLPEEKPKLQRTVSDSIELETQEKEESLANLESKFEKVY